MRATITLGFVLLVAVTAKPTVTDDDKNASPIIGVMVKEIGSRMEKIYPDKYKSYIIASKVKFIEGGGARVIPVFFGQDEKYYKDIIKKTNGILFPPGGTELNKKCGSADASVTMYKLAVEENKKGNHYPIFALGQGMETLVSAAADKTKYHVSCTASKMGFSLEFKKDFETSKLYEPMPKKLIAALKDENITSSFQAHCLTEEKLSDEWRVMSTNKDEKDVKFVSSLEHKVYPFYAVQFRPEEHLYEWKSVRVEHSLNAVLASQYFAAFFVQEARKNHNKFDSVKAEREELIYNYPATYTRKDGYSAEQVYFFGADKGITC